jgi:hypothetical protein
VTSAAKIARRSKGGSDAMMHEEFAERVAGRFEAHAEALDHRSRMSGHNVATARATELRTAAAMAREEAVTVTLEEAPPPEAQA